MVYLCFKDEATGEVTAHGVLPGGIELIGKGVIEEEAKENLMLEVKKYLKSQKPV